ncbi:MAG: NTP transferase domain-containing protein [Alphaproteobacteria bacterium]|nr:NTP transferase domain-containing protein [Alphaproteobacteria bacterium]
MAGGNGSRLYPLTSSVNKHLLPIYDKPMIYYSLTTLMLAGIRDIVLVSTEEGAKQIGALLGDGSRFGVSLRYLVQPHADGIAQGLVVAADELAGHDVAMILGDNIFVGSGLEQILLTAKEENRGATVFSYEVANPQAYGILRFNAGKPVDILEKAAEPPSRLAITGLYFFDRTAIDIARTLKPSERGEYEITDVNKAYLRQGRLDVRSLGRGTAWIDGGTPGDLFQIAQFVHVMETRTGLKIAVPEEIALRRGFIDRTLLANAIRDYPHSEYRDYLETVINTA